MRWTTAFSLTLLLAACPSAQPTSAPAAKDAGAPEVLANVVATCAEVRGSAQVRRRGKPYWEALAPGGTLRTGDWVRTGADSTARVELLSGHRLELGPEAVLVVEERPLDAGVAGTQVAVEAGEVRATAPEDDELAPLLLRDRNGGTTVVQPKQGSERAVVRLSASPQGRTEIALLKGSAEVRASLETVTVERGMSVMTDGDKALQPTELPDFPASVAPGIDARLKFDADAGVRLEWARVPGATGYRVQVASDLAFTEHVRAVDVTSTDFFLAASSKGLRVWRVATRTAETVGEYGFARRVYFEAEEPVELLLGPEDGQVVPFSNAPPVVTFSWQGSTGSPTYRLLVSRSADPRVEPVVSVVTSSQQAAVGSLGVGEYFWGVYLDGAEPRPLFLMPRRLVLKEVSRALVKTPRAVSDWE